MATPLDATSTERTSPLQSRPKPISAEVAARIQTDLEVCERALLKLTDKNWVASKQNIFQELRYDAHTVRAMVEESIISIGNIVADASNGAALGDLAALAERLQNEVRATLKKENRHGDLALLSIDVFGPLEKLGLTTTEPEKTKKWTP
jgi:hypothetical protein